MWPLRAMRRACSTATACPLQPREGDTCVLGGPVALTLSGQVVQGLQLAQEQHRQQAAQNAASDRSLTAAEVTRAYRTYLPSRSSPSLRIAAFGSDSILEATD